MTPSVRPFATLSAGREFEEALWASSQPTLQAWCSGQGLSVPASYRAAPGFVAACAQMERQGWPVVVRRTGGGCVPQGPGVLNLAWKVPAGDASTAIDTLYGRFSSGIVLAMRALELEVELSSPAGAWCPGRYDLSVAGRKLVGISQRRSVGEQVRSFLHAAIFVDPDLDLCFAQMIRFHRAAGLDALPNMASATTIATERAGAPKASEGDATTLLRVLKLHLCSPLSATLP